MKTVKVLRTYICDRCGATLEVWDEAPLNVAVGLPAGWTIIEHHLRSLLSTRELCEMCTQSFDRWLKDVLS